MSSNWRSVMFHARTWILHRSSGKYVVISLLTNMPGRCAISSAPLMQLWSEIVTKSMPRRRAMSYTARGCV